MYLKCYYSAGGQPVAEARNRAHAIFFLTASHELFLRRSIKKMIPLSILLMSHVENRVRKKWPVMGSCAPDWSPATTYQDFSHQAFLRETVPEPTEESIPPVIFLLFSDKKVDLVGWYQNFFNSPALSVVPGFYRQLPYLHDITVPLLWNALNYWNPLRGWSGREPSW